MGNNESTPEEPKWINSMDHQLRFFVDAPFAAAKSLHSQLRINEDEYSGMAAFVQKDGRSYYLYGAADEALKVGLAIIRWTKLLHGPDEPVADDPKERHIYRITLEYIQDEQQMWIRKLTEWLTNLICFGATNDQKYFRLFLEAEAYDCQLADLCDLKDYFKCDSANMQIGLERIHKRFKEDKDTITDDSCWFLKKDVFKEIPKKPGKMFASMQARLSKAMKLATAGERLSLGISYAGGFGKASRYVHPIIAEPRPPITELDTKRNLHTVFLLCMHTMYRAHQLADLQPTGLFAQVVDNFEKSYYADTVLKENFQPNYQKDDIVLALGHLAEVIEKYVSEYGLESYHIRFLVRGPLEETPEDCVPAAWTEAILRKSWVRDFLQYHWSMKPETQDLLPLVVSSSEEELMSFLRPGLIELEKRGLPIQPLIPPAKEKKTCQSSDVDLEVQHD